MNFNTDVLIIGAGLAGLRAAGELHSKGINYLMVESSSAIGGRVSSEEFEGYTLDRGFQVLLDGYDEVSSYLDLSSLKLEAFEPGARIWNGEKLVHISDPIRRPQHLISTLTSSIGNMGDKLRLGKNSIKAKLGLTANFPNSVISTSSTEEYLVEHGYSEAIIRDFFRPFFGGVFLDESLQMRADFFCYLFDLFATSNACLPSKGMQALAEAMASKIDRDKILFGQKIKSLSDRYATSEVGGTFSFKQAILAVDAPSCAQILNAPHRQRFSGALQYYFEYPYCSELGRNLILNPIETDSIRLICSPSEVANSYNKEGSSLGLLSVDVRVPASRVHGNSEPDISTQQISKEAANILGSQVKDLTFLKRFEINHALPRFPATTFEAPETVVIAGDHTIAPSINHALLSGRLAAEAIATKI